MRVKHLVLVYQVSDGRLAGAPRLTPGVSGMTRAMMGNLVRGE